MQNNHSGQSCRQDLETKIFQTPFGSMKGFFSDNKLSGLIFSDEIQNTSDAPSSVNFQAIQKTGDFLHDYVHGASREMPSLNMTGTVFQKRVWELLLELPFGSTISYGDLTRKYCEKFRAERMCSRAIAHAVAMNRLMVIVPCHRVIRSNGMPGQYAGGADIKVALLHHERDFASSPICLTPCTGQVSNRA